MNSSSMQSNAPSLDTPLWVVVPAAGSGQRLGGEIAKQYQELDGLAMLQRTLDGVALPYVEKVVVVLAEDDVHWQTLEAANNPKVITATGGQLRAQSVLKGIELMLEHASDNTWVLVHDAARPLLAASDIKRLITTVYNSGAPGGLLATPVHDTLKRADEYAGAVETVIRSNLWQAQTPQMFRAGELRDALQSALHSHGESVTDEASAMEFSGVQPLLVEALEPNFKITRPVDWALATALLQAKRLVGQSTGQSNL